MRSRTLTTTTLLIVLLLAAVAAPGTASGGDSRSGHWFSTTPRGQQYWERVADLAKPPDPVAPPAGFRTSWTAASEATAEPVAASAGAPAPTGYGVAGTLRRAPLPRRLVDYERTEITDPSVFPYVTHGRLFIRFPAGSTTCSGTIVPDEDNSLVITAAHCLLGPDGTAADAVAFAPGYRLGEAPFGYWEATAFGVTDQYHSSTQAGKADVRFDIGAVEIARDDQGVALADAFGWRGITFNRDWAQTFSSFGYPKTAPFDGEKLYRCRATVEYRDSAGYTTEPFPLAMGCDMTRGASGGGWVTGGGMLNSVSSYAYEGNPETLHGPYFGSEAYAFYEATSSIDVPAVPAKPAPHDMTISLSLTRHVVASGSVRSPDGYRPCSRSAAVRIFRNTGAGRKLVKNTVSDDLGRYRIRLPDKPGSYEAVSLRGFVDELNPCAAARSNPIKHRH